MCGQFAQIFDDSALMETFRLEDVSERVQPEMDLRPGNLVNTVVRDKGANRLQTMEWGFRQAGPARIPAVHNSRIETLLSGKGYAEFVFGNRCAVPVSGFYERKNGIPYYISLPDESILILAGVFIENEKGIFCSLVTTDSEGDVRKVHHRMPLILDADSAFKWLDPSESPRLYFPADRLHIRPSTSQNTLF